MVSTGPMSRSEHALDVHPSTVERLRQRFVEEGFEVSLLRKEQKNRKAKKIDGRAEAHLVALACSFAPRGEEALDPEAAGRPPRGLGAG